MNELGKATKSDRFTVKAPKQAFWHGEVVLWFILNLRLLFQKRFGFLF